MTVVIVVYPITKEYLELRLPAVPEMGSYVEVPDPDSGTYRDYRVGKVQFRLASTGEWMALAYLEIP